jgi:hypothetical protein
MSDDEALDRLNISDIVVVPANAAPHPADATHKPAGDPPILLAEHLQLIRLPWDEAEPYMDACEPASLNYHPHRQYGQRYPFVRSPAPRRPRSIYAFDSDGLIQTALQLSRLIVPNSHSIEYALRRVEGFTHPPDQVQLAALRPHARFYAFRPSSPEPDWLDQAQGEELGHLLRSYLQAQGALPKRVTRAMQMLEFAYRTQFYEIAYVHVVTAVEALLKTSRYHGAAEQFMRRVPRLARELGIVGMTARRARRFYRARSSSVHGSGLHVSTLAPANRELAAMQHVLGSALRRAIEDHAFRSIFRSATTVRTEWPVTWRGRSV